MRNDPMAVGNRRLLKLADLLDALPDERFQFHHWVDEDTYKGKPDLSCGTTACALGWATTIPAFRKLGLRLRSNGPGVSPSPCMVGDAIGYSRNRYGTTVDHVDRAADRVFHLSVDGVKKLFLPDHYGEWNGLPEKATRKEVADNIRAYVASAERGNGRV